MHKRCWIIIPSHSYHQKDRVVSLRRRFTLVCNNNNLAVILKHPTALHNNSWKIKINVSCSTRTAHNKHFMSRKPSLVARTSKYPNFPAMIHNFTAMIDSFHIVRTTTDGVINKSYLMVRTRKVTHKNLSTSPLKPNKQAGRSP